MDMDVGGCVALAVGWRRWEDVDKDAFAARNTSSESDVLGYLSGTWRFARPGCVATVDRIEEAGRARNMH